MNETRLASPSIIYPEADGQPMTESDATRDYLIYCIEVCAYFFIVVATFTFPDAVPFIHSPVLGLDLRLQTSNVRSTTILRSRNPRNHRRNRLPAAKAGVLQGISDAFDDAAPN